ncbi:MAG: MotA/TolQ/ExbB proton channel family protein [Clostridia bacterium]|nr:MotA/TolQ/ExbB proton channel family protein [Clostridia bacterium]
MNEWVQALGAEFLKNVFSSLVYVAIVVLFVISLIKCVFPVWHNKRLLRRAARAIRKGAKNGTAWQDENFLGGGSLYPHWQAYLNNLFFADGEYHNPADVEDYINEETAIENPGRSQLGEAVPGLMVSLGFLGTLIGISTGLSNFSMDTSDAVMQAIQRLLPSMQYAFMTSIVGVVASVLLTLITRIVSGAAVRALDDFHAAMNSMPGVQSVDPMTQIAIYQQEQTALIQQMAADLKSGLPQRMAKITGEAMAQAIAPLDSALRTFSDEVAREQIRGTDLLVQRFIQQMNHSVNGQFQMLEKTLEETCRDQREMAAGLKNVMEGLGRTAQSITEVQRISDQLMTKYDSYLDRMNRAAAAAEDGYGRMAANAEHLEVVARQQNGYLQSVGKLQGEIVRAMEKYQQTTDGFMMLFREENKAAQDALRDTAGELRASGDTLAASHNALVNGVSKDIDKTFNTFFKNVNQSLEQLSVTIRDVRDSVSNLPEEVAGAADLYAQQADRLEAALGGLTQALDDCASRLNRA